MNNTDITTMANNGIDNYFNEKERMNNEFHDDVTHTGVIKGTK